MNEPKQSILYRLFGAMILLAAISAVLVACSQTVWISPSALGSSGDGSAGGPVPSSIPVDLSKTYLVNETQLKDRWGIEIWQVNVTGVGGLINLRLRILDDAKASDLIGGSNDLPILISERTGMASQLVTAEDAKITPSAGKIYIYFYSNPDGNFRPGDPVTIVIGSVRLEHYILQY